MRAYSQYFLPARLNRKQLWMQLAILVPILTALTLIMALNQGVVNNLLRPISWIAKAVLIYAVIGRFRDIGIGWLLWTAAASSLIFFAGPHVVPEVLWQLRKHGFGWVSDHFFGSLAHHQRRQLNPVRGNSFVGWQLQRNSP